MVDTAEVEPLALDAVSEADWSELEDEVLLDEKLEVLLVVTVATAATGVEAPALTEAVPFPPPQAERQTLRTANVAPLNRYILGVRILYSH